MYVCACAHPVSESDTELIFLKNVCVCEVSGNRQIQCIPLLCRHLYSSSPFHTLTPWHFVGNTFMSCLCVCVCVCSVCGVCVCSVCVVCVVCVCVCVCV